MDRSISSRPGFAPAGATVPAGDRGASLAGARVYLHTRARRPYVAGVLASAVEHLRAKEDGRQVLLVSGWRLGPHFDLRAADGPLRPIDWDTVAASLGRSAGSFPQPDPEAFEVECRRQAEALGPLEGVAPPYAPLRPHGHSEVLAPVTGGVAARGQALLLDPVLETAAAPSDGVLQAWVAEAFLALASTHPFGIRFGTFSFRSHAEAFLHWAAPRARYRDAFEARRREDRTTLTELVERAAQSRLSGAATTWRDAFAACQAGLDGTVHDDDLERFAPAPAPEGGSGSPSPFHQAVAASGVLEHEPAWFAGYRLTINLFYQLLPALDVSPIRRFYLCYALAETVDEVYQEPWQDRLAAVAGQLSATR